MSMVAVWFSSGAASAVAAFKTLEHYGSTHEIRIVNNPVAEEDSDNLRFLHDVGSWLGVEIETASNPKYPTNSAVGVWAKRKYMAGVSGAPCTLELKKNARYIWEKENKPDFHVLGFTFEERKRHERFIQTERSNVLPVLIDLKITKADCYQILLSEGIKLPRVYSQGYPNANCIGCVKATSPTYWNHVRTQNEEVFNQRAKQSREIGAKLVRHKGQRIFLDELPTTARGRPMKNMDVECGIFCEERFNDKE